jgi:hypothetical protein
MAGIIPCFEIFFKKIIVVLGIHCDIYLKSSFFFMFPLFLKCAVFFG